MCLFQTEEVAHTFYAQPLFECYVSKNTAITRFMLKTVDV